MQKGPGVNDKCNYFFFDVLAEEWLSGQNALPLLMSLKSGTRIRTFKPVVYKPGDNGNGNNSSSNSAKFNFLSEEARGPDYRPIDVIRRSDPYRQSPKIDHRPLGAESYGRASASNSVRSVTAQNGAWKTRRLNKV